MKKFTKKMVMIALVCILFAGSLSVPAKAAHFGYDKKNKEIHTVSKKLYSIYKDKIVCHTTIYGLNGKRIQKMTTSKPGNLKIDVCDYFFANYVKKDKKRVKELYFDRDFADVTLTGNRYGKQTVKFTMTNGQKLKAKLNILPYENPFKSFTISGKEMKKGFDDCYIMECKNLLPASKNKTINVKGAKNWRVTYMEVGCVSYDRAVSVKKGKSSMSMVVPSKYGMEDILLIRVTMKNKKTGGELNCEFHVTY